MKHLQDVSIDDKTRNSISSAQRNEITEHYVYKNLSKSMKDDHNKEILEQLSHDELSHYHILTEYVHEEVKPNKLKILWYILISKVFGITFGLKVMERGEREAYGLYENVSKIVPILEKLASDEHEHEEKLIHMIHEDRLRYVGSVVRGLNDALVELTGTLAGFTLAIQNTRIVAVLGFITGVAASLSMAASEYLATKSEDSPLDPLKAAFYTGATYGVTLLFLVFPYLIFRNIYLPLAVTLFNGIITISIFNYYISIVREISFKKRFVEMVLISLGIAGIAFALGYITRMFIAL
jgi:VIT1/CCC1 family predicted Fe2+/Mn2+ transporter